MNGAADQTKNSMTDISQSIHIKRLSTEETGQIYQDHLRCDFPDNERKPYFVIRQEMEKGAYETYGAYTGGRLPRVPHDFGILNCCRTCYNNRDYLLKWHPGAVCPGNGR